jgi:signal transduction histidine kinase
VEERDFSLRVDRTGTREMDVLVDAFNRMLIEVGEQTDALAASNRFLESEMAVRRRAEEALRVADKNKDQFLATLAHELRNPLAPLLNGVAILRLPARTESESGTVVSMMERQVKQMVRLIDDLLDVSRIATNKLVLRTAPMDLRDAVNAAVETLAPFIRDRRHTLHLDIPPTPIPIIADSTRLAQVFANLLNNAAKFTEAGKDIHLTVSATPEGIGWPSRTTELDSIPAWRQRYFSYSSKQTSRSSASRPASAWASHCPAVG